MEVTMSRSNTKKVGVKTQLVRKAPTAPKRFKSSYILFFIAKQDEIKRKLGHLASFAPEVSKEASRMWKNLSDAERNQWNEEANKDKARFIAEKSIYDGPWFIPHQRAKKDPSAPKRNPSAFLLFSQVKRVDLKKRNPGLKNTDVSRILGQIWRNSSDNEKRPYFDQEERERELYKMKMSDWRIRDNMHKKKISEARSEEALRLVAKQKEQRPVLKHDTYGAFNESFDHGKYMHYDDFLPPLPHLASIRRSHSSFEKFRSFSAPTEREAHVHHQDFQKPSPIAAYPASMQESSYHDIYHYSASPTQHALNLHRHKEYQYCYYDPFHGQIRQTTDWDERLDFDSFRFFQR